MTGLKKREPLREAESLQVKKILEKTHPQTAKNDVLQCKTIAHHLQYILPSKECENPKKLDAVIVRLSNNTAFKKTKNKTQKMMR